MECSETEGLDKDICAKPCKHCPFRKDVKPFLEPERGAEIAVGAYNKYNYFPCHKTTEADEESDAMHVTEKSKECAGFLTLQIKEGGRKIPEGFKPSELIYESVDEMCSAYGYKEKQK